MRKIIKLEKTALTPVKRKRVAAYARVSSGKDTMLHSLSIQISYYNEYIGSRGDWQLIGIYADEAMTGTRDDRPQFQRLLADCRAGKIDMVITKSVTRLARNTVTVLETARELKELGIDIYFEKENIHTMGADGELMLTLLASFAQEESWSASENQKWRIRKKFEQGEATGGNTLGYHFEGGTFHIVPDEAVIVRQIFGDYLSGMGILTIVKKLECMGVPTRHGGHWSPSTVRGILHNEKYAGDLLLQKYYRPDHISKKDFRNHGEATQYFVEGSHEPIISREEFRETQLEFARRRQKFGITGKPRTTNLFTGIIHCMLCGKSYCRRTANTGGAYQKPVWRCSTCNLYGREACPSQQIPEKILIAKTSEALGTDDWDRDKLMGAVAQIQVPGPNRLVYVFTDGHTQEVAWQHPSRRESWTKEMKQEARERQMKRLEERRKQ